MSCQLVAADTLGLAGQHSILEVLCRDSMVGKLVASCFSSQPRTTCRIGRSSRRVAIVPTEMKIPRKAPQRQLYCPRAFYTSLQLAAFSCGSGSRDPRYFKIRIHLDFPKVLLQRQICEWHGLESLEHHYSIENLVKWSWTLPMPERQHIRPSDIV